MKTITITTDATLCFLLILSVNALSKNRVIIVKKATK